MKRCNRVQSNWVRILKSGLNTPSNTILNENLLFPDEFMFCISNRLYLGFYTRHRFIFKLHLLSIKYWEKSLNKYIYPLNAIVVMTTLTGVKTKNSNNNKKNTATGVFCSKCIQRAPVASQIKHNGIFQSDAFVRRPLTLF